MEANRIIVEGKDAENKKRRAFDWIIVNGVPYAESVNKKGWKIKTPANEVIDALKLLLQQAEK